jgi:phospholipase D1/2
VKGDKEVFSKMNGEPLLASRFAFSLRVRLMKEHLGFNTLKDDIPDILLDPLDDELFKMMKERARSNTFYYNEIFSCYPSDSMLTFSDILLQKLLHEDIQTFRDKYENNKNNIIGNIVVFPLNFLLEESLNRSYFCKEIVVPIKNFI